MALGSKYVHYEKRDGAAWLRLDRLERRNAFTHEMYCAIAQACVDGDADPEVQLTVLTGTDDVFSVGGDLGSLFFEDPERQKEDFHKLELFGDGPGSMLKADPFVAIHQAEKLVVAVVNGLCHAGGFIASMLADVTVASDRAKFRVPELLRGVADPWLPGRLALYVGMERAKYIMFTCRTFDAQQALDWGLISQVIPHEELEAQAQVLLDEIMLTGPNARAAYKLAANKLLPEPNYAAFTTSIQSDECREGLESFMEKRPPVWVPRSRVASLGRL